MHKIEVYTDGQCSLCRWMRARVDPLDRNHRIEWLDYNDPEILQRAAPHTREEMAEEMHTRTADGRWAKGYSAWIEVIRVLPRWKWLAPVLSRHQHRETGTSPHYMKTRGTDSLSAPQSALLSRVLKRSRL